MKKSLLLISLALIVVFSVDGQQLVRSTTTPDSKTASQKSLDDTQQPNEIRKKRVKKKRSKKKKEREIIHTAPDQRAIDSIKNEKMKLKK